MFSHFASSSSWAIARSESVSIEITRGSPLRSAATVSSTCSRVGRRAARYSASSGPPGPS